MFPKKGNNFQNANQPKKTDLTYSAVISASLRAELGGTHQAVKTLMRWTKANERTVKHWLAGTTGPRGEHLISLMRQSDAVLAAVLQMAGRNHVVASTALFQARTLLADTLAEIDACICDVKRPNGGEIP